MGPDAHDKCLATTWALTDQTNRVLHPATADAITYTHGLLTANSQVRVTVSIRKRPASLPSAPRASPYRSMMQIPPGRDHRRQSGCVTRRDVLRYAAAGRLLLGLPTVASALTEPVAAAAFNIAGTIVFLDPGHNGANDASINRQVPTGRGGTKECQTTGTTTDMGYPEHTFNWDLVLRIRAELSQLGVRTALSRGDDSALGPCVDQRAAMANASHPNAIVSIHADGGPPGGRGFHVNYSAPPLNLNEAQAGPAVQLARTMRDQLVAAGFTPSTYCGTDGLYGRSDLASLNLAQYPSVLIELVSRDY